MRSFALLCALLATNVGCSLGGFCNHPGGSRDATMGERFLLNDGTTLTGRQLSAYVSAHEFHPDEQLSDVAAIRIDLTPAVVAYLSLDGPLNEVVEGCTPVVDEVVLSANLVFQFRDGTAFNVSAVFAGDYLGVYANDGQVPEGRELRTVRSWTATAQLPEHGCDPRICGNWNGPVVLMLELHEWETNAVFVLSRNRIWYNSYDLVVVEPSNWMFE